MLVAAGWMIGMRGGDLVGAKLYAGIPEYGFLYCVVATTIVYALIPLGIPWIPKQLIATMDGERNLAMDGEQNLAMEAEVMAEIAESEPAA
jgi:hypothetical protein